MEGKGSFFNIILLFILAFLSLTLAGLAGYVFLGGGGSSKAAAPQAAVVDTKIPTDDELAEYELYKDKTLLNLKNGDPNNAVIPIIQITCNLKYLVKPDKKVSSIKDPVVKLDTYKNEIMSLVGSYFQALTREEANEPEAKEKASKALADKINNLLTANEEKKGKVIYGVIFSYWFVT